MKIIDMEVEYILLLSCVKYSVFLILAHGLLGVPLIVWFS